MGRTVAFFSYTRDDDAASGARLSAIRAALETRVDSLISGGATIFQDTDDIKHGEDWLARLEAALAEAVFLIPIVTPRYFGSEACLMELERFRRREAELGRGDLILPVYWATDFAAEYDAPMSEPQTFIHSRQRIDWRTFAYPDQPPEALDAAVMRFGDEIARRVFEMDRARERAEEDARRGAAAAAAQRARDDELRAAAEKAQREAAEKTRQREEMARLRQQEDRAKAALAPQRSAPRRRMGARIAGWLAGAGSVAFALAVLLQDDIRRALFTGDPIVPVTAPPQSGPAPSLRDLAGGNRPAENFAEGASGAVAPVPRPGPPFGIAWEHWIDTHFVPAGEPGSVFRECADCPEMVVIPAGTFDMGSAEDDPLAFDWEKPQHEVVIDTFFLARTEVTVGQFRRFVEATGYDAGDRCRTYEDGKWEAREGRSWRNPGFEQSDDHPVACVSWHDARAYIDWLNTQVADAPYRLPSESEWEYAARAGAGSDDPNWWGGQDELGEYANCRATGSSDSVEIGTSPVDAFAPSPFDLHDMIGNLWEWTADDWQGDYSEPRTQQAFKANGEALRVVRGGSWGNVARFCRAACRSDWRPGSRNSDLGFRPARGQAS